MNKKIQGIYKIVNKINNKIYIGQSVDIYKRFNCHKRNSKKNKRHPLYASIKKNGLDNFEFIIIEEVINIRDLDLREQYWLDHYQSYLPEKGYNIVHYAQSTKGYKHTDEAIVKMKNKEFTDEIRSNMSKSQKGRKSWNKGLKMSDEFCKKISLSLKGKPSRRKGKKQSQEAREKISEARKGKPLPEEHKKNIALSLQGKKQRCGQYKNNIKFVTGRENLVKDDENLLKFKQAL